MVVSYAGDGVSQRSASLRSHLVFSLKHQALELPTLSKQLLRQSIEVAQRLKSKPSSLSRRSDLCQSGVAAVGHFRSSISEERRTKPVLLHRRRRFPEVSFVPVFSGMFLGIPIRIANLD